MSESREALRRKLAEAFYRASPATSLSQAIRLADTALSVVGPALDAADRLAAEVARHDTSKMPFLRGALDAWREASK